MSTAAWGLVCGVLIAGGAAPAHAAVFEVGPSGDYFSIQAALTEASVAAGPSHEVRVQRGAYFENLRLPRPCCGGRTITLSGGWNANFSTRVANPAQTLIDGQDRGRVLDAADLSSGLFTIDNLTLQNGLLRAGGVYGTGMGAGMRASMSGTATLALTRVHVRSNTIRGTGGGSARAYGAGAMLGLYDSARLTVSGSRFEGNMILPGDSAESSSHGGGLELQVFGGTAWVNRTEFVDNWAYGTWVSRGGGLDALVERGPGLGLEVKESLFQGNVVNTTLGEGTGAAVRAMDGDGSLTARIERCRLVSNVVGQSQLDVGAASGTRVEVTNSLVAEGRGGVRLLVHEADAHLANLTVVGNQLQGIRGSASGGQLSVFNTIAYDNTGGDLSVAGTTALTGHNLVGIDPGFVPGSYELDGGSAAADRGFNAPPASPGILDLANAARLYNGTVDIGAYEWHPY
jgi:hypothetical protein